MEPTTYMRSRDVSKLLGKSVPSYGNQSTQTGLTGWGYLQRATAIPATINAAISCEIDILDPFPH